MGLWKYIREPLADLGIFAAAKFLVDKAKDMVADKAKQWGDVRFENEKQTADARAEVFDIIRQIMVDGNPLTNMRRRFQIAKAQYKENNLTGLLCKLLRCGGDDPHARLKAGILWLEQADEPLFEQMMDLLEHDPVTEQIRRAGHYLEIGAGELDRVAEQAAPHVDRFTAWLKANS